MRAAPGLAGHLDGFGRVRDGRRAYDPIVTTHLWLKGTPSSGIERSSAGSIARPTGRRSTDRPTTTETPTPSQSSSLMTPGGRKGCRFPTYQFSRRLGAAGMRVSNGRATHDSWARRPAWGPD